MSILAVRSINLYTAKNTLSAADDRSVLHPLTFGFAGLGICGTTPMIGFFQLMIRLRHQSSPFLENSNAGGFSTPRSLRVPTDAGHEKATLETPWGV